MIRKGDEIETEIKYKAADHPDQVSLGVTNLRTGIVSLNNRA